MWSPPVKRKRKKKNFGKWWDPGGEMPSICGLCRPLLVAFVLKLSLTSSSYYTWTNGSTWMHFCVSFGAEVMRETRIVPSLEDFYCQAWLRKSKGLSTSQVKPGSKKVNRPQAYWLNSNVIKWEKMRRQRYLILSKRARHSQTVCLLCWLNTPPFCLHRPQHP